MKYKLAVQLQAFEQYSIEECIEYAIDYSKQHDVSTVFDYHGITVVTFPDSTIKRVYELYQIDVNEQRQLAIDKFSELKSHERVRDELKEKNKDEK